MFHCTCGMVFAAIDDVVTHTYEDPPHRSNVGLHFVMATSIVLILLAPVLLVADSLSAKFRHDTELARLQTERMIHVIGGKVPLHISQPEREPRSTFAIQILLIALGVAGICFVQWQKRLRQSAH